MKKLTADGDYTMPVLSEQKRDFLITMARIEIRRWGNLADQQRGGYMADLIKIALASLTAKPVGYTWDRGTSCEILAVDINDGTPCGIDLYAMPPVPVKQEGEQ